VPAGSLANASSVGAKTVERAGVFGFQRGRRFFRAVVSGLEIPGGHRRVDDLSGRDIGVPAWAGALTTRASRSPSRRPFRDVVNELHTIPPLPYAGGETADVTGMSGEYAAGSSMVKLLIRL